MKTATRSIRLLQASQRRFPLPQLEPLRALSRFSASVRRHRSSEVDHRLVRVFDVFAGKVFVAPKAQRRLGDVHLACEEIAARWDVN